MSLLLIAPNRDMDIWRKELLKTDPNIEVEIWPDVRSNERVQFAVCWNHPSGLLNSYPNLKAVSSLGAGVDHILEDEDLPEHVAVARVVSASLSRQMKEYAFNAILNYQRNTLTYRRQQEKSEWQPHHNKKPAEIPVGVMGLGELGRPLAAGLAALGYEVSGWSKSAKEIEGVTCYPADAFNEFLERSRILICLLPLTPETEGIIDLEVFKTLQHPAYLINVARGEHLVEEDLIYAIDKNWVGGASLDVFTEEPLPESHPFWNRDSILITPHVASWTPPDEVAGQIVENYKRVLSGMEPVHKVDKDKGY